VAALTDLTHLRHLARDGDDSAISVWGDVLEEAGDYEGADALHSLPDLLKQLQVIVQAGEMAWRDAGYFEPLAFPGVQLYQGDERYGRKFNWSCRRNVPNPERDRRGFYEEGIHPSPGILVRRWDDLHEAVEWLARRLDILGVKAHPDGRTLPVWGRFRLDQQHLRPLGENQPRRRRSGDGAPPAGWKLDRVSLYGGLECPLGG
jgi:hypothetical protein